MVCFVFGDKIRIKELPVPVIFKPLKGLAVFIKELVVIKVIT
jgi:hypothetical protein